MNTMKMTRTIYFVETVRSVNCTQQQRFAHLMNTFHSIFPGRRSPSWIGWDTLRSIRVQIIHVGLRVFRTKPHYFFTRKLSFRIVPLYLGLKGRAMPRLASYRGCHCEFPTGVRDLVTWKFIPLPPPRGELLTSTFFWLLLQVFEPDSRKRKICIKRSLI